MTISEPSIMTEEEERRQEEAESQSALLAQYVHTRNLHSPQCTYTETDIQLGTITTTTE